MHRNRNVTSGRVQSGVRSTRNQMLISHDRAIGKQELYQTQQAQAQNAQTRSARGFRTIGDQSVRLSHSGNAGGGADRYNKTGAPSSKLGSQAQIAQRIGGHTLNVKDEMSVTTRPQTAGQSSKSGVRRPPQLRGLQINNTVDMNMNRLASARARNNFMQLNTSRVGGIVDNLNDSSQANMTMVQSPPRHADQSISSVTKFRNALSQNRKVTSGTRDKMRPMTASQGQIQQRNLTARFAAVGINQSTDGSSNARLPISQNFMQDTTGSVTMLPSSEEHTLREPQTKTMQQNRLRNLRQSRLQQSSGRPVTAVDTSAKAKVSLKSRFAKNGMHRSSFNMNESAVNLQIQSEERGSVRGTSSPKRKNQNSTMRPDQTLGSLATEEGIPDFMPKSTLAGERDGLKFFESDTSQISNGDGKPAKKSLNTLSAITVKTNNDLLGKTEALRDIEKVIEKIHLPPEIKKGVNLAEQLETLQDNIRNTQVQLNQLVAGGKDIQTLSPETNSQIDLPQMGLHMLKIFTKEHKGPLKLTLEFIERFKGDIKVSVHTHSKVSLDDYIWQFTDQKTMVLRPIKTFDQQRLLSKGQKADIDKNQWQPEAVYVQFFSIKGIRMNVCAVFSEEAQMRENRLHMKESTLDVKNLRGKFQAIVQSHIDNAISVKKERAKWNEEIKRIKRQRRIREKANMDVDFVMKNIDEAETHLEDKEIELVQQRVVREERTQRYKEKRIEDFKNKDRYNYLSLGKWDFLRVKRAEYEAVVEERIRNRDQMKKLIILAHKYKYITHINTLFRKRTEELRIQKLQEKGANLVKRNLKAIVMKRGQTADIRMSRVARNSIMMTDGFVRDKLEDKAAGMIKEFLIAYSGKLLLESKIRAMPAYFYRWRDKAVKVFQMRKTRRIFLNEIVSRELDIMKAHYKSKKKLGKKTLQKLTTIKPHNLEKILDDFFFHVCYAFYKRQMQIWVLLQHKYLRRSAIDINERRFMFKDLNDLKRETTSHVEKAASLALGQQAPATPSKQEVSFPIYLSEEESQPLFEITQEVADKLIHLFKGTTESAAVGKLALYMAASEDEKANEKVAKQKAPVEEEALSQEADLNDSAEELKDEEAKQAKVKVNHYKEMGLTKEKCNLMTRISKAIGVSTQVGKSRKNTLSPKQAKSVKTKGLQKRKTIVQATNQDIPVSAMKQFVIEKIIPEPMFRYIPDRATIQRLITRAANMKDDLAEFGLYGEDQ